MKYILKSEKGIASMIALLMVGMLTLIGLAALSTSDDEVTIAGNELQEMRAFYAAEGGLDMAASLIQLEFDSTGLSPNDMPEGEFEINRCQVEYSSVDIDSTGSRLVALSQGTLAGLNARARTFALTSVASSDIDHGNIQLEVNFEAALVPIFQFAVFYEEDLEIAPGPFMNLIGRVHTNENLYLQSANTLQMESYVTAVGDIYHGRKGPGGVSTGDVLIKDPSGAFENMKISGGWMDATQPDWYDSSISFWGGRVQDAAHGQERLNVPLEGASADPHLLIEKSLGGNTDSYEAKSSLKFIDSKAYQYNAGIWTNVTADMTAKGIIQFNNNQFTDGRESELVDVMELNMERLYDSGYAPSNGVIYFSDKAVGGSWPALRLTDGSEIGAPLTIASENPIYTLGDFNNVNKQPVAIMGDAVTFLSNNWNDALSAGPKSGRIASVTTVNAAFLTGNVETTSTVYSGGYENLPRFLETWSGKNFNWMGSMVCLWNSVQADGNWGGSYYSPPNRMWQYDLDFDDINNMPPETPNVRVFQRTGWSQKYVGY